jgi:TetR/AcrR family transcriptional regulator, tetracycline repressor protein
MPHPRRVDRAAIVVAAIDVLEERGLDGLSLRVIAERLGVRQPALYHHLGSKAELLDAMAALVLDRAHEDRLPAEGEPWDAFVARNARSMRRAMLGVRDGARLIASAGPRGPAPAVAHAQVGLLESAGFDGPDAVVALIAVSRYTIGCALEQQTARDRGAITFDTDPDDDVVRHLTTIARQVEDLGPDHEFEVGLAALLRGLAP